MPNSLLPVEFENMIRDHVAVSGPDAKFVARLRSEFIAKGTISLKPARSISMNVKRAFIVVVLIILALLATSPAVATALQTLLGYIPGIGLVDEAAPTLVLADPVVVQREGVILTVEQAVATNEKTVVIYRHVETVPTQPAEDGPVEPVEPPVLRLPDGNTLGILAARRLGTNEPGILYALDFGPLPPGVTQVTLELDTLAGLRRGEAPENWQAPIRFIEGDASQLAFPVFEPETTPTAANEEPAYGLSIMLDKIVDLPDGYIMMGISEWADASIPQSSLSFDLLAITDANGRAIEYGYAQPDRYAQTDELRKYWAYEIFTREFVAPLRLDFNILLNTPSDATFEFTPGPNPQNGQIWDLNLDVLVNGRVVKVVSAEYSDEDPNFRYLRFTLTSDADVTGAQIISADHPPSGFGGGGAPATNMMFTSTVPLEGQISAGPMRFSIVNLQARVAGDWTVTWDGSRP